jgi:hypothetical protein
VMLHSKFRAVCGEGTEGELTSAIHP